MGSGYETLVSLAAFWAQGMRLKSLQRPFGHRVWDFGLPSGFLGTGYETLVSPTAFWAQGVRLWALLARCIMECFPVFICRVGGMPRRVKSVPEPRRGGGIYLYGEGCVCV